MSNKAFQKRIYKVIGGKFMIEALGFVIKDGYYVMETVDEVFLKECLALF
jgi:hypothetical protein